MDTSGSVVVSLSIGKTILIKHYLSKMMISSDELVAVVVFAGVRFAVANSTNILITH